MSKPFTTPDRYATEHGPEPRRLDGAEQDAQRTFDIVIKKMTLAKLHDIPMQIELICEAELLLTLLRHKREDDLKNNANT